MEFPNRSQTPVGIPTGDPQPIPSPENPRPADVSFRFKKKKNGSCTHLMPLRRPASAPVAAHVRDREDQMSDRSSVDSVPSIGPTKFTLTLIRFGITCRRILGANAQLQRHRIRALTSSTKIFVQRPCQVHHQPFVSENQV